MSSDGGAGISYEPVRIFFDDLSETAQKQALAFKGVGSPQELNWDVFEMAIVSSGTKYDMTQDEIDLAALSNIGYYR